MAAALRFGDIITLTATDLGGQLSTQGYPVNQCKLFNEEEALRQGSSNADRSAETEFRVCPHNTYFQAKELLKLMKTTQVGSTSIGSAAAYDNGKLLEVRRKHAEEEAEANAKESKRLLGCPVHYGHMVQLQHVRTGRYLRCNRKQFSMDEPNCVMTDLFSGGDECWLIFLPRLRTKSEGDIVNLGDVAMLHSMKNNRVAVVLPSAQHSSHVVAFAPALTVGAVSWKLGLSRSYQEHNDSVISLGDSIRLYHLDQQQFLGHRLNTKGVTADGSQVMLRGDGPVDKSMFTLWEVRPAFLEDAPHEDDPNASYDIQWGQSIRLRSIATGGYLAAGPTPTVSKDEFIKSVMSKPMHRSMQQGGASAGAGGAGGERALYTAPRGNGTLPPLVGANVGGGGSHKSGDGRESVGGGTKHVHVLKPLPAFDELSKDRVSMIVVDNPSDPSTLFQFQYHSIDRQTIDSQFVNKTASLYLQHVETQTWLRTQPPPGSLLSSIVASLPHGPNDVDDKMELHPVRRDVDLFRVCPAKISETVGPMFVRNSIKQLEHNATTPKGRERHRVNDYARRRSDALVMTGLLKFLTPPVVNSRNDPTKLHALLARDPLLSLSHHNRRHLMRELGLLSAMIRIFVMPVAVSSQFDEANLQPCKLALRILEVSVRGCKANAAFMIRSKDNFDLLLGLMAKHEDLGELTQKLLLTISKTASNVELARRIIIQARDHPGDVQYVEMLAAMCRYAEMPDRPIQDLIVDELLLKQHLATVLSIPQFANGEIVCTCQDDVTSLTCLPADDKQLVQYERARKAVVASMRLMSNACLGRNEAAIIAVSELLDNKRQKDFDVILRLCDDASLDSSIRTAALDLVINVMLERRPHADVTQPRYIHVWSALEAGLPSHTNKNGEGAVQLFADDAAADILVSFADYHAAALKALVEDTLGVRRSDTETGVERVRLALLRVCRTMVRFGFYDNLSDLERLSSVLCDTIDDLEQENEDTPVELDEDDDCEHAHEEDHSLSMIWKSTMVEAIGILEAVLDLVLNKRINDVLWYCHSSNYMERFVQPSGNGADVNVPLAAGGRVAHRQELNAHMRSLQANTEDFLDFRSKMFTADGIVSRLLQLSKSHDKTVGSSALHLCIRLFNQHYELQHRIPKLKILLHPSALEAHRKMKMCVLELEAIFERDKRCGMVLDDYLLPLKQLTALLLGLSVESYNASLDKEAALEAKRKQLLESGSNAAEVNGLYAFEAPLPTNQQMCIDYGVHKVVMGILESNPSKGTVRLACHTFLQTLCQDSAIAQVAVFDNLDAILHPKNRATDQEVLVDTLIALLRNNVELITNLSTSSIRSMAHMIDDTHPVSVLLLLQLLMLPEPVSLETVQQTIVQSNQPRVAAALVERGEDALFCLDAVGGDEEKRVLHSHPSNNRDTLFHMHIVATLSVCARVTRPGAPECGPTDTTHVVRDLIPLDRIRAVLCDRNITAPMRGVYITALHHVWLAPALGPQGDPMLSLLKTSEMEHIFEALALDIDERLRFAEEATVVPVPTDEEWRQKVFEATIVLLGELFVHPSLPLQGLDGERGVRVQCMRLMIGLAEFAVMGGIGPGEQFDLVLQCLGRMMRCHAFVDLGYEDEMQTMLKRVIDSRGSNNPRSQASLGGSDGSDIKVDNAVAATMFAKAALRQWGRNINKQEPSGDGLDLMSPGGESLSRTRRRFFSDHMSDGATPKVPAPEVSQANRDSLNEYMKMDYVVNGLSELLGEWHASIVRIMKEEPPERFLVALLNPGSLPGGEDRPSSLEVPMSASLLSTTKAKKQKAIKAKINQVVPDAQSKADKLGIVVDIDNAEDTNIEEEELRQVPDATILEHAKRIHLKGTQGRRWTPKALSNFVPTYAHLVMMLDTFDPNREGDVAVIGLVLEVFREFVEPMSETWLDFDDLDDESVAILKDENKARRRVLVDAGLCEAVLRLVACDQELVVTEALKLLNNMLADGYKVVQNRLFEHFVSNNLQSFFFAMRNRFRQAEKRLRDRYSQLRRQKTIGGVGASPNSDATMAVWNDPTAASIVPGKVRNLRYAATGEQLIRLRDRRRHRATTAQKHAAEVDLDESSPVALTLKLMRWMCEGQHTGLQNWLRGQANSRRSVNLIQSTVTFLVTMARYMHEENKNKTVSEPMSLAVLSLSALNEACIDCHDNQKELAENVEFLRVLEDVILLGLDETYRLEDDLDGKLPVGWKLYELQAYLQKIALMMNTVAPLLLLCSTSDDAGKEMAQKVLDTVGFVNLAKSLDNLGDEAHFQTLSELKGLDPVYDIGRRLKEKPDFWVSAGGDRRSSTEYCRKLNGSKRLQDAWEELVHQKYALGFGLFGLLRTLIDQTKCIENETELETVRCHKFFEESTGRVEVLRGDKLSRVYFPIDVKSRDELTKEMRVTMQWKAMADTDGEHKQIEMFIELCDNLISDLNYRVWLSQYAFLNFMSDNLLFWKIATLAFAFIVNIAILISYNGNPDHVTGVIDDPFDWTDPRNHHVSDDATLFINIVGFFQIIFVGILYTSHILTECPASVLGGRKYKFRDVHEECIKAFDVPRESRVLDVFACTMRKKTFGKKAPSGHRGRLVIYKDSFCFVKGGNDVRYKWTDFKGPSKAVGPTISRSAMGLFADVNLIAYTNDEGATKGKESRESVNLRFSRLWFPTLCHETLRSVWAHNCVSPDLAQTRLCKIRNLTLDIKYVSHTKQLFYYTLYVVFTMLGVVAHPFYYCFQLLDIVPRSKLLQKVLQAVTKNFRAIILTFLLLAVCVYIYAVIGFYFFRDRYIVAGPRVLTYNTAADGSAVLDGVDGEYRMCDTLFWCLMGQLSISVRNGGTSISEEDPCYAENKGAPQCSGHEDYWGWTFARYMYDLSFYIIIITVLLNIVLGIIIDGFGELRQKKEETENKIQRQCFICSMSMYELDRNGGGFERHVKDGLRGDHCMWNYLFFLQYIKTKDKTDYDAMEAYVADCIENKQSHWVPINRAICIDEGRIEEEEEEDEHRRDGDGLLLEKLDTLIQERDEAIDKKLEQVHDMIQRVDEDVTVLADTDSQRAQLSSALQLLTRLAQQQGISTTGI